MEYLIYLNDVPLFGTETKSTHPKVLNYTPKVVAEGILLEIKGKRIMGN